METEKRINQNELALEIAGVVNLVRRQAWKFWRTLPVDLRVQHGADDLTQEALLALWKEGGRWQPEKGKFTTFAAMVAKSALCVHRKKAMAEKRRPAGTVLPLDDPEVKREAVDPGIPDIVGDCDIDGVMLEWMKAEMEAS